MSLRPFTLAAGLALVALFVSNIVTAAYLNHDTIIYTLVGKGIYQLGLPPYEYVFDHKPLLIYLVYGPLSFLEIGGNVYAGLTLVFLLVLALIVCAAFTGSRWPLFGVLIAMTAATLGNVGFTGNSEIVYVPLQLLAVGLLLNGSGSGRLWGSAAAAVAAVNCNYIAAIPLLPALLAVLWMQSGSLGGFLTRGVHYAAAGLTLTAGLLGFAAAVGVDIFNYLGMQAAFLTGYSQNDNSITPEFLARISPFLVLALLPLVPLFRPAPEDRAKVVALEGLLLGALAALALGGKFYQQYIFSVAAPAVTIFLLLPAHRAIHRAGIKALLLATASLSALEATQTALRPSWSADLRTLYTPIAEVVGDAPVLGMRSSVVPFYFSSATPYHPVLWSDHVSIIHGPAAEDAVYADLLAGDPPYVMTAPQWCATRGRDWTSCTLLHSRYEVVAARDFAVGAPGYELWRRQDLVPPAS